VERPKYRFAVGVAVDEPPGAVGFSAVNRAVESLGGKPSFAFVAISKEYESNRKAILEGVMRVLEDTPLLGAIVLDPIMTWRGPQRKGVAVALWTADEDMLIDTHLLKLHNREDEEIKDELLRIFQGGESKRYLNLVGVLPYYSEGVGERLERILLSLSEYIDLAVIGVVGAVNPGPWSIIHNGDFYSSHMALATLRTDIPLGVFFAHGFHPLVPMEVTEAHDRFIVELDNSPAYEVITDILMGRGVGGEDIKDRGRLRKVLSKFQMAISDPAAAGKFKTAVIRDIGPRGVEVNISISVGDTVWLMEANPDEIVKSTMKSLTRALSTLKDVSPAGYLFFENHLRISALGERLGYDVKGLKQASPLPFLGVPSSQELVIHHSVYSGLHSGAVAGVLFTNSTKRP